MLMPVKEIITILIFLYNGMQGASGCQKESFGADSFVCVCSNDYCDDFPEVIVQDGHFQQIVSSKLSHRFEPFEGPMSDAPLPGNTIITINLDETHQTMIGFGGAFTDATGINIADLSPVMQEKLLRSYFSPTGIEYNMGRIIIGCSDFSARIYSYDDVEDDILLEHFALAPEDYSYKLPFLKWALAMSERPLLLFGTPWSPPTWMKEHGILNVTGGIKREMWQVWSDYIVKFVESYESEGIPLWGMTAQDQPVVPVDKMPWDGCKWNATEMRDWIKTTLGPTLEAAGLRRLQLMVLDHNRDALPWYPDTILDDPNAYQYVDGVGLHWYKDKTTGPDVLDVMHEHYPEKFILYTESCIDNSPVLGSWAGAEYYTHNIIEDVNHWSTGWVDWNMALDLQGGPSWASDWADAPILVKKEEDIFYKQPSFYAMAHFSKYVTEGDVRVSYSIAPSVEAVEVTAFLRASGEVVVVLMNTSEEEHSITIQDNVGSVLNLNLESRSLNTVLYKPVAK